MKRVVRSVGALVFLFAALSHPGFGEAIELRRWDDLGKDPRAEVPPLEAYAEDLKTRIAANAKEFDPI